MAKKIDLGVSKGPNAAEKATIRAGNKKTEVHYAEDSAPEKPSAEETERASRADTQRVIHNETNALIDKQVPGGKKQGLAMSYAPAPGTDSADPTHRAMAQHSADFIAHGVSGNRAKMEASRAAFHAVRASSRGVPKGIETPCSTPGCLKTGSNGANTCGDGSCGAGPTVQRPRG